MADTVIVENSVVELISVGIFGILAGSLLTLFSLEKFSATSDHATLLAGFGGAVLGSGMSAVVSFILAKQTSAETLRRDNEARRAEQKSYVLRLMVKASIVLSDVIAIQKTIDQSLSNANDRKLTGEPLWKRVLPMVGSHQTFDIDPAELSPIIAAKDNELMQASVTLFMQHRNLLEAIKAYAQKRDKVKDVVTNHFEENQGVITSALTQAQMSALLPLEVELESIITQIRAMLVDLKPTGERVTYSLGPAMRKYLGDNTIPIFSDPAAETAGPQPEA